MVILNAANIGISFTESKRSGGHKHFSWEGVKRAFDFYQDAGVQCQIVCQHRIWLRHEPSAPESLRQFIVATPVVDDHKDVDDLFGIRLAIRYGAQLVDNDNYRDWQEAGKQLSDPAIREWVSTAKEKRLKVSYCFDVFGNFMPDVSP